MEIDWSGKCCLHKQTMTQNNALLPYQCSPKMKTLGARWLIKTVYCICCMILVIYLLIKIKECIENYIAGSTYYNTSVVRQDDVTFPELTFCSDELLGLKSNVLKVRGQIL